MKKNKTIEDGAIWDNLPVLPLQVTRGGRAVWLGPQWAAYAGRSVETLLGEAWLEIVHPGDRGEVARAWADAGDEVGYECRLRGADGAYRWTMTRAVVQTDGAGQAAHWVGAILDLGPEGGRAREAEARAALEAEMTRREQAALARAEESERRARLIAEVAQAVAQATSLDAALEAATEALAGAFPGAGSGVWLHDAGRRRLRLAASRAYSAEGRREMADIPETHDSTIAEAFRRRRSVVYNLDDAGMPPTTRRLAVRADVPIVAVAGAPLLMAGRVLGALSLVSRGHTLDDSWLETLRAVGVQVAAAVERAGLLQRERAIADRLQGALLPALADEAILRATGLNVASHYRSGTEGITVGGDFYDVWPLPAAEGAPTRLAVVLGDVSGKGLEAAVQTAALRHAVQAYAHQDPSPGRVVARLSELVMALDLLPHGFATMFFATVETATGRVDYCSAGHESLLLRGADGRIQSLEATAPALGLLAQVAADSVEVSLDPGGQLVLYTDGVTEARQPGTRRLLGVDGFAALLTEVGADAGQSATALAARLLGLVEEYAGGRLEDDAALLVILRPQRDALTTGVAAGSSLVSETAGEAGGE